MESQDPRAAVSRLIIVLRTITRLVKVLPFAYLVIYAAALLTESFLPDRIYSAIDAAMNVPPFIVLILLILSKTLKLCAWHRAACLIPMASRLVNLFDEFVVTLTSAEVTSINIALGISTILFIAIAYNHIFYGRERVNQGNA